MKRVWKTADSIPADGRFLVRLDGKPLHVPGGTILRVPFTALAKAIALEWAQVPENFTPDDLPLTSLTTTAQNRVSAARPDIINQLVRYGLNDLLCYRAVDPPALAAYQHDSWQPWLDWAARTLDVQLATGTGILPIAQPPASLNILTALLTTRSDYELAGLGVIVPALGSLVLGLALLHGALQPATACVLSELDTLWQEQKWGTDSQTAFGRQQLVAEVEVTARFWDLCRL
jgi:chaperone required for assembly of F1-ATPase